ncbi:hypothetical protein PISL3812_07271 [Talaromyces islandicus]|uniref:Noranthrone monooxygenase n=1 Tax=Talaromyces islandicus TaxID=28573 RepID=A0A0U1M3Q9_TALIS|nr:hypothetical protein PISL3812_07271 [Talaromyces islandicus]
MSDSTLVKSAHIAATVLAALTSGGIVGISVFTIPAIALPSRNATGRARETPGAPVSHIAQQWSLVYNTGKVVFPSMAAASALLYSYVAYAVRGGAGGSRARCASNLYFTAAGLVLMIVPITGVLVFPVNEKIEPYVEERDDKLVDEGPQDSEFPGLLRKWAQVNAIRGLFPAIGAALGATVGFGLI